MKDKEGGATMYLDFFDEVKGLTKALVQIPSIVRKDNGGESRVAKYIYDFYGELDYFKENKDQLVYQKTLNDEVDRHNCISLLRGKKGTSNKTIILMGHIDTVGIDDYREVKAYATEPDILVEKLKELNISDKVRQDIETGEYMFGRGALDMKAGVAGHMAIMKYFSENLDELDGNLVHLAECDEEDGSRGVISALKIFNQWKDQYGLEYIAAINADYSTPHYDTDINRYIYFGTIGKLLPAYYAFGAESHVGHPFSGFDPNLLIAEITRIMDLNPDLTDEFQGERTLPPISLKQKDTKEGYTVQTALSSLAYYNFFTHKMSPRDVSNIAKDVGLQAFNRVVEELNKRYEKYCKMVGEKYEVLPWKPRVFTWEEYIKHMEARYGEEFNRFLETETLKIHESDPKMDLRDFSTRVIEATWDRWEDEKVPTLIIFFGSVYSAPIALTGEDDNERKLLESVKESINEVQDHSDRPLVVKYFYPYISDASFMAIDSDIDSLNALKCNMPAWGVKYTHPIDDILKINVPVVNIGTFGYDGHSITERVHMNHTFSVVPNITLKTIKKLLA